MSNQSFTINPGITKIDHPSAYALIQSGQCLLIDVREKDEYDSGFIPTAVNLSVNNITKETASAIAPDKAKPIIVYCRSGRRTIDASKKLNVTNEGGYDYTIAFLKNICGLWLIQESRRQWIREGKEYSYAELEKMALECEPFKCFIDPDAPEFATMGNLPQRVKDYCKKTNQYVPQTVGEIMRCIYESLALKYRLTFDGIMECTGKIYDRIHVMGGGTKDKLLLQMTAESCNVKVFGGPIEATALGNIILQLKALGEIESVDEGRMLIAKTEKTKKPEKISENSVFNKESYSENIVKRLIKICKDKGIPCYQMLPQYFTATYESEPYQIL